MPGPQTLYADKNISYTGGAIIGGAALTVPKMAFKVRVCFTPHAAGVLSYKVNAQTNASKLREGDTLVADAAYTFDVEVTPGDSIAFYYSVSDTLSWVAIKAIVEEQA